MSNAIGKVTAMVVADTKQFKAGMKSSVNDLRSWQRQAQKVFTSTRTPAEQMSMEIAKLNAMHKKGYIDAVTHARGVAQLNAKYATTSKVATVAGASMKSLGRMAALYVGPTAVLAGLGQAFRVTEDVDRAMHSSLAIMSGVGAKMKAKMEGVASEVARTTIYSTEEAAKAYYYLASAGMDAGQSIKALPTVANFAQAGMFDLSTATDLLTDAQMAMGMSSKDAQKNMREMRHVGDVLVGANTIANASVQQFSEALTNKAAASARSFNKSIEEVTATLAVFASQGIKGVDAGTKYDVLLKNLSIKATENASAFKKAGIAVFNEAGAMRNMAEIVADLDHSMAGLSAEQQVATMLSLGFTAKTISTTKALMGNADALREVEERLHNMGGKMEKVARGQMTEFQKGWEALKASLTDKSGVVGGMTEAYGKEMQHWFGKKKELPDNSEESLDAAYAAQLEASRAVENAAADKKVTDATNQETAVMRKLAEDIEAANTSADSLAKSLQFKIATAGMSGTETELYKLEQAYSVLVNADTSRLNNAKELYKQSQLQTEEITAQAALSRKADSLTKSLRTPQEVLRDQIADLRKLREVGAIDAETFRRGKDKATADFRGPTANAANGAPAMLRNTAGARQSFVGANEMLKKADEQIREIVKVREAIESNDQPEIAEVP